MMFLHIVFKSQLESNRLFFTQEAFYKQKFHASVQLWKVGILVALPLVHFLAADFAWNLFKEHVPLLHETTCFLVSPVKINDNY